MRYLAISVVVIGWLGAFWGAVTLSERAVDTVERAATARVAIALTAAGVDWAVVDADGLQITLSGQAPDKTARESALAVTALAVEPSSISDQITFPEIEAANAPLPITLTIGRFGELTTLNGEMIRTEEASLLAAMPERLRSGTIKRFVEIIPRQTPDNWAIQRDAALALAALLQEGQVTVSPSGLSVTANFTSPAARRDFEQRALARTARLFDTPPVLELTAPLTQAGFAHLLVAKTETEIDILFCDMPSENAVEAVTRMLRVIGATDTDICAANTSEDAADTWPEAAVAGLTGLAALDAGRLELKTNVLSFTVTENLSDGRRAAVRESVEEKLPTAFTLRFSDEVDEPPSPPGPQASLTLDRAFAGPVMLAGPRFAASVAGAPQDRALMNYAKALFGMEGLIDKRSAPSQQQVALPLRDALTLLDVLATIDEGTVRSENGSISITGIATGHDFDVRQRISAILGRPVTDIAYAVTATPSRNSEGAPVAPDPAVCEDDIAAVQDGSRIVFAPSSAVISEDSGRLLDRIADIMRACAQTRFRIEGHTDSRGSEALNLAISTARAESVLDALLLRGVFLDRMEARGFGEVEPIADNETEAGRALNRRIEFSAITDEPGGERQ